MEKELELSKELQSVHFLCEHCDKPNSVSVAQHFIPKEEVDRDYVKKEVYLLSGVDENFEAVPDFTVKVAPTLYTPSQVLELIGEDRKEQELMSLEKEIVKVMTDVDLGYNQAKQEIRDRFNNK